MSSESVVDKTSLLNTEPTRIVLASGNQGKLKEFASMFDSHFQALNIELVPQNQLKVSDVEETGLSFVENAILKARHACRATGLPALADDSGLEVDALKGAPGIYSARYANADAFTDKDTANNAKLLDALTGVPKEKRSARFQCVLVYMRHALDPTPQVFQGHWDGVILESLSGAGGFGYDPLFFVPNEKCSAAQLSKERKNAISHRGKAMTKFKEHWVL
ncbi:MAG: RdgB/HAM1 family non-canonical purine NTP pyrophosphatase [Oleibacter sp.]|nr:RdgB/HAM1 family non-canonical purine NTP pyrophosphatase [Thalassolituus sp.]